MSWNVQNIQASLSIQQTYSSTLCTHINNIYNKLSELQKHIQHHCMYPHQTDTVQINALEYNPDIDGDNQPNTDNRHITVSVQGTLNTSQESSILEDDNSTAPDNISTPQNQQETNWPDTPTIQILDVSSTTSYQPPEVMYNRCQIQPSLVDLEIPKLEENSDEDQFTDLDNFITHHSTHQESERIQQEYFATLQNLSDDKYYTEIDRTELQYHTPVSPYDWPTPTKRHQDHHKQALHDNPQRNLNNYLGKVEEKPDGRNSIATNHLATKCTPWRVEYNRKLRKTNDCVNGIPLIANILPLYEPYKGFLTQCTTQQEHTKPRHQPSDRDQRARDRLRNKASAFQAKIKSPVYIALGAAALQTVHQTFDPDFPVSFHVS